jgi:hypothetical protein
MAYGLTQSVHLASASTQFLTRANNTLLAGMSGAFTLECWVKLAATGVYYGLNDTRTNGGSGAGYSWRILSTGATELYLANGSTATDNSSTSTITDTNWHHVATTRDGSGNVLFYLDGVSAGSTANSATQDTTTSAQTTIGGVDNPPDALFFNGNISLMRVWKGVARTQPQISANMCNVLGTTTNLSAEWTLNNTLNDNSGNSLTLTNNNSATFTASVPATCSVSLTAGNFLAFM